MGRPKGTTCLVSRKHVSDALHRIGNRVERAVLDGIVEHLNTECSDLMERVASSHARECDARARLGIGRGHPPEVALRHLESALNGLDPVPASDTLDPEPPLAGTE